jgi:hypothetical protein
MKLKEAKGSSENSNALNLDISIKRERFDRNTPAEYNR